MSDERKELARRLDEVAYFLERVSGGYKVSEAQQVMTLADDAEALRRAADLLLQEEDVVSKAYDAGASMEAWLGSVRGSYMMQGGVKTLFVHSRTGVPDVIMCNGEHFIPTQRERSYEQSNFQKG